LGISLNSQHSWDSPCKAFILLRDRNTLSSLPLRSCASLQNPFKASYRRFSGLIPRKKPCPSTAPEGLVRVGAACSLGLSDLSGSQNSWPGSKASPFRSRPLALKKYKPHNLYPHEPQGSAFQKPWPSPLRDAGPYGLLHRLHPLPFQRINPWRTIFSSRSPRNLTTPQILLLARNCPSPNGR
jgi:hypothetical protein